MCNMYFVFQQPRNAIMQKSKLSIVRVYRVYQKEINAHCHCYVSPSFLPRNTTGLRHLLYWLETHCASKHEALHDKRKTKFQRCLWVWGVHCYLNFKYYTSALKWSWYCYSGKITVAVTIKVWGKMLPTNLQPGLEHKLTTLLYNEAN